MKLIDDNTVITAAATAFIDGSKGYAKQEVSIRFDGEPCGVTMHSERSAHGAPWLIYFTHPGAPDWKFSELRDALPLSEYKWERTK